MMKSKNEYSLLLRQTVGKLTQGAIGSVCPINVQAEKADETPTITKYNQSTFKSLQNARYRKSTWTKFPACMTTERALKKQERSTR